MLQVLARRFRQWFHRPEVAMSDLSDDDGLPRAAPVPAPQPFGLEDTAPVEVDKVLPPPLPTKATPPPLPPPRSNADAGVVSKPIDETSDWSAVIAAAKARCRSPGHA